MSHKLTRLATTMTGLASEVTAGTEILLESQMSLGVRAGCQLWERFFASSGGGPEVSNFISFSSG